MKYDYFKFIYDIIYSNEYKNSNIEYNYDIINYLANRFKIPLEDIFINYNNDYNGVYVYKYHKLYNLNDNFIYINRNKFIIIPEPKNPLSLHIAIHELIHYYKKHNNYSDILRNEYEAERLSLFIFRKLKCGKYQNKKQYIQIRSSSYTYLNYYNKMVQSSLFTKNKLNIYNYISYHLKNKSL